VAARLTRSGRRVNLRLDQNWVWAKTLAVGFDRLRTTFELNAPVAPAQYLAEPRIRPPPSVPWSPTTRNQTPIDLIVDHDRPNTLIPHRNPPRPKRHRRVEEGG
jgi:hypothetical protein